MFIIRCFFPATHPLVRPFIHPSIKTTIKSNHLISGTNNLDKNYQLNKTITLYLKQHQSVGEVFVKVTHIRGYSNAVHPVTVSYKEHNYGNI